jgi:YidC/Oxa1 family membrane protein insertase
MIVMMLTSCSGNLSFSIPADAAIDSGFQYGIFQGFIVMPMGVLINIITTSIGSAAIAMIIVTLIVRTITLPVTIKGQIASKGIQELQPKMMAIEDKYRGRDDETSKQKKQQEIQKIYSSMGVNPLMGMLYPFVSLPLFMGVWRATSLSAVIKDAQPILGFAMGTSPSVAFGHQQYYYIILMLLVGASQFFQFKITNHLTKKRNEDSKSYRYNPKQSSMDKQMKLMTYGFTIMMIFMSFTLISAMSLYLIVSALISIGQAYYIDHHMRKID